MKKPVRFVIFSAVLSVVSAAGLANPEVVHIPRDGDRLHPGMVGSRSLIQSVTDSTRTLLLNPEAAGFDTDRDASVYVDGDTISYVQFATKHRFLLSGDTLFYIGYENRASDFRLDRPVTVAVLPPAEGRIIREGWSGRLFRYGVRHPHALHGLGHQAHGAADRHGRNCAADPFH